MNQRNLSFVRGTKILRIPDWDNTGLEFARLTKHNVGSPNNKTGSQFEFYEYNPAREAEELMKKDLLELEMAILAKEMPEDKIIRRDILDGKLDIKRNENKVYWAQGGGLIGAFSRNENPETYLVNLALSNTQDGNDFKQQLQRISQ